MIHRDVLMTDLESSTTGELHLRIARAVIEYRRRAVPPGSTGIFSARCTDESGQVTYYVVNPGQAGTWTATLSH